MTYGKGANVAELFCDAARFKENIENPAIVVLLYFLCKLVSVPLLMKDLVTKTFHIYSAHKIKGM